jgi:hypothetical protein
MPESVNTLYITKSWIPSIVYPKRVKYLIMLSSELDEIYKIRKIYRLTVVFNTMPKPLPMREINIVIPPKLFKRFKPSFLRMFDKIEIGKIWIRGDIPDIDGWYKEFISGTTIFTRSAPNVKSARKV